MGEPSREKTLKDADEKSKAVVDVEAAESIRERLTHFHGGGLSDESFTIFRVPASFRQRTPHLYEPTMLSVGPYHRGKQALRAMEKRKWQYLHDLLSRQSDSILEECVNAIKALEQRARRCYAEDTDLSSNEFVGMLLLDGCFIIELMRKYKESRPDSMLDLGWSLPLIRSDLIMLDNQIPFFVLEKLYALLCRPAYQEQGGLRAKADARSSGLIELAARYLSEGSIGKIPDSVRQGKFHHLLHLFHTCYRLKPYYGPSDRQPVNSPIMDLLIALLCFPLRLGGCVRAKLPVMRASSSSQHAAIIRPRVVPCASELQEAGVKFKRKEFDRKSSEIPDEKTEEKLSGTFLDITFTGGTMKIPKLEVYTDTVTHLMNLVAFEQCKIPGTNYFTNYALLMDGLIDTEKDVAVLQECGVVMNSLSSSAELAVFFNQLCELAPAEPDEPRYKQLSSDVWNHYESKWPKWRAKLMRDYFSNPWAILSLVGALILLALTIVQTIFTVYTYFHPPS